MTDLAISTAADTWPAFQAVEDHEYVETWRTLEESVEGHRWQQAAIAYRWREVYGPASLKEFSGRVGASRRRCEEYDATYRAWHPETGRERSRILSFHHHTIAARALAHGRDPEACIQLAEAATLTDAEGNKYTRQLSTRELDAYVKTGVLPDGTSVAGDAGDTSDADSEADALTPNEAFYLYELTMHEYEEGRYNICTQDNAILVIAGKLKRMAEG